jgi:hypothetical protein
MTEALLKFSKFEISNKKFQMVTWFPAYKEAEAE